MEDTAFSDDFCRFLQTAIPAVEAAELLLALKGDPARWWSLEEVIAALGPGVALTEADARRYVEGLQARGLVAMGGDGRMRYRAASEPLDAHATTLEQAYRERPVTLIRMIYALRDGKIRSFADAFKLTRK